MCTVSWLLGDNSYQLLCNRDEKKTRARATPPTITHESNLTVLAPRDPEGGGTWLAVNSMGVSIALLNGNAKFPHSAGRQSRGLLPERLIRLGGVKKLMHLLRDLDLTPYLPFSLLVFDPSRPIRRLEWDGETRRFEIDSSTCGFATSSSFEPEAVQRSRDSLFQRMQAANRSPSAELLYEFHESHGMQPNAFSPCMHRSDAETVSFSWVRVETSTVNLFYAPGAPCRWVAGSTLEAKRIS